MPQTSPLSLVLASSSRYRRQLLERLQLAFTSVAPQVDEAHVPGEPPEARALRLAQAKALAVAERHPQAVVIGSDQVAALGTRIFDKPGTASAACQQLAELSGCTVQFHTAVAVRSSARELLHTHLDTTAVVFRKLSREEIERYVAREQPLDTAGSFKSEALGICLLARIESTDPTALVGLPLIWVCATLRDLGFPLP